MPGPLDLFIACAPGLEPLLAEEVLEVLQRPAKAKAGGVTLQGGLRDVATLNLALGVATHVLVRIAQFPARHFSQLDKSLQKIDWSQWLQPGAPLSVRVKSHRSKLYHSKGIEQRVRDAVPVGLQMSSPEEGEDSGPRIMVRIEHDQCTISMDSSGAPLHRRGYRLASAKAPLREDLARAVVRLSGWKGRTAFADPFCGSGTLGIEAALWARGLAPGMGRSFAFEQWPGFEAELLEDVRSALKAQAQAACAAPIWLSDRDRGAVQACADNAERAGVLQDIDVQEAAMGRAGFLAEAAPEGVWVSNPPHGGRIGKKDRLRNLHQSLGSRFNALPDGWSLTLVVRDRRLAYVTGVKLGTHVMTEHGGSKIWVLGSGAEKVNE